MASTSTTPAPPEVAPPLAAPVASRGDTVFRVVTIAAGASVLLLLGAIVTFLLMRAMPAWREAGFGFLTERAWFPDSEPPKFGVAAMVFGTIVSSLMALLIAVPVAVGSALFLTEIAPRRIARWIGYVIDLLAAVPSVVYGLWGVFFLVPKLVPVAQFLDGTVGAVIPVFDSRGDAFGRSLFAASVILAIMVLPIIAAISREVFVQVPRAHREAALALGATRWETIRHAVLPPSKAGLVAAVMLGLGRALGETIAVALVLAATYDINVHVLEPGGNTIAANIATKFGEAGVLGRQALIASGLVLFAITLLVNALGRWLATRSRPRRR